MEPTAEVPAVHRLLDLLELEPLDRDLFRGHNPSERPGGRVFGGQVAGQALRAATLTVDVEHNPHSLHGYFLRPGESGTPIIFQVDRIRDGRSFTTRRVKAVQHGEAIFSLEASFQKREDGGEYQVPLAEDVPAPEDSPPPEVGQQNVFRSGSPFEVRELGGTPADERGVFRSTRRVWVRTKGPLPDDPAIHACALAYVSDMGVVMAARVPLGGRRSSTMAASLDHALWFHRPVRADGWLFYDLRPVSNANARGFVHGTIHTRDGVLAASVTQEALIRVSDVTGRDRSPG